MLKRIISLVMVLMILLGVCACSSSNETKDTKNIKDKKTLSIALLYNERLTEIAISKFEAEHPNIKVEVKDYEGAFSDAKLSSSTVEDEHNRCKQAQENYKKTINTALMAGNGPDIIDTSVSILPYRKLAEKNVLANMSELIKNDKNFDISNYQQNLLNACKYKDNLYIMPINFSIINTLGMNKNTMNKEGIKIDSNKWTWEEFFNIAKKINKDINRDGKIDQYALPKMLARELFQYIYINENFIDYDNKTAKFDSKEFIELLKFVKDFPTETVCSPTMGRTELNERTDPGTIGFIPVELQGYSNFSYNQAVFNGEVEYLNMPLYNGKRNAKSFELYRSFAINEKSELKEEAWEFIKVLLCDEVQTSADNHGFPVNLFALSEQAGLDLGNNSNFYEGRNVKALTLSDVDMINKMMGEIETIDYSEDKADKIVVNGADEFFTGKKTAEEAAKQIQNKINIYLGE